MYDYMTTIVDNKMNVYNVAMSFHCSSRKITDVIRNFLELAFKPLADYISDELSKRIMMGEEDMTGIKIEGNKGVVNFASGGSTIKSIIKLQ